MASERKEPRRQPPDQVLNAARDRFAPVEQWSNIREALDQPHVRKLADSIDRDGLLCPGRARLDEGLNFLVPVAGHHRFAAMLFVLKWDIIPYLPVSGVPSEAQLLTWQWQENECRLDMLPMARARSAIAIRDAFGETNVDAAARLGIQSPSLLTDWESWITVLTAAQQAALDDGRLKESYASCLCRCDDRARRDELFAKVISGEIASRDALKAAVHAQKGGARPYHRKEGEDGSDKIRVVHPRTGQVFVIDTARPFEHYKAAYGFVARLFQDKDVNSFDDLKTRLG